MSLDQSPSVDCVPQRSGSTTTTTASTTTALESVPLFEEEEEQPAGVTTVDQPRLLSKRKLDDYGGPTYDDEDNDVFAELVSVRMRKDEPNAVNSSFDSHPHPTATTATATTAATTVESSSRVSDAQSATDSAESTHSESPRLQFFIRMISEGKTRVIQAYPHDTVKSLHERIQLVTGIPVHEQRLIYGGKQLQWERSLAECSIENDAGLQLVGRMRSTEHSHAWQVIDEMVSIVRRLCRGEAVPAAADHIKSRMSEYLSATPKKEEKLAAGHLQIFMSSSAPAALVMLYMSMEEGNSDCADSAIRHFLDISQNSLPKSHHNYCAPIVLEFCKLLRRAGDDDPLYLSCRSTFGMMLELIRPSMKRVRGGEAIVMEEIFPFISEMASRLCRDLGLSMETPGTAGPLSSDVRDFTAFVLPLRTMIMVLVSFEGPISVTFVEGEGYKHPVLAQELEFLYHIFIDLLNRMDECLRGMDGNLIGEGEVVYLGWSQYLAILKELHGISKIYQGAEEQFWTVLRLSKTALCALIIKYAKRADDHQWLLERKDVTNSESRRHLAMMMFPEAKEDYEELHEMLIDRSQLLAESFEYIQRAESESLHAGLFMEFKNEEATGPGVLREWFFLVCQAIFNPENALFVACPNDRRRFYPNPTSRVDPMHLEYFSFSGRVIALALMHKVQVGIVFDRVFFLQLAGKYISLEDIRDADPCLYNSCKQILDMDSDFIDSDALGLTFVREVEEFGSRKVVELCPGGKSKVVNSQNREEYVRLLIEHRFVTSISDQVSQFAQGFGEILSNSKLQKFFFQSLELEDLDWMLHGSETAICVDDWKAHTEYNGYKETDPQIFWFWKSSLANSSTYCFHGSRKFK
ncbi:E3 ubiquitin-protein ligase UPL5-like isoform X2 [Quercus robur]|uniref:E3 ubiquitin-protein ligase UPL5-like isoform X2 n=1 Tax=Quercus robur TaxID=38942 RepID=UPI002161DFC0|nr:E3 ubiquitin-protein ligase UPL5-like isoform X2 [Quercus robur]